MNNNIHFRLKLDNIYIYITSAKGARTHRQTAMKAGNKVTGSQIHSKGCIIIIPAQSVSASSDPGEVQSLTERKPLTGPKEVLTIRITTNSGPHIKQAES